MPIRVILYDDNEALRQSIQVLLELSTDIDCIATLPNALTIEDDIRRYRPDVILMDIDMPGVDGVTAVRRAFAARQGISIIMLTVFDDNDNIFQAICAGSTGYILKHYADSELIGAIQTVAAGGAPMTGSVAKKVLQMLPKAQSVLEENTQLTVKESAILKYLGDGYSYKMIAAELGNSIDTVRFHIKNIYAKLHVNSATQAVSKAIRDKLI